jgi:hypothetical protein
VNAARVIGLVLRIAAAVVIVIAIVFLLIIGFGGHVGTVTTAGAATNSCVKYADLPSASQVWLDAKGFGLQQRQYVLCNLPYGQFGPYENQGGVDTDYNPPLDQDQTPEPGELMPKDGCWHKHGRVYDRTRSWPFQTTLNEAWLVMRYCYKRGRVWSHHVRKYQSSPGTGWSLDTSGGYPLVKKGWRRWHGDGHGAYRFYYEPRFHQCFAFCVDGARLPVAITCYGDGHCHKRNEF